MTVRPTFTGSAAVPVNLTLAISPSVTSQASPGAQVITATPTGGTGAVTYAWTATYSDGSSAAALMSGSGATRTLTTTTPGQVVQVSVVATDSGSPTAQTATAAATLSVAAAAAPTLTAPSRQTKTYIGSESVTFPASTAYGTPSYSATLSKPTGSTATLSGSGLGPYTFSSDMMGAYVVTLTVTDGVGNTAKATGIVSVEVAGSVWSTTADVDFAAMSTASASRTTAGTSTFTAGSYTASLVVGSSVTSAQGGVGASGLYATLTTGTGNVQVTIPVSVTSTKKTLIMYKVTAPTLTGTVASARVCLSTDASVTVGTQVLPTIFKNNASSGYDVSGTMRLSGTGQGNTAILTGTANPGTVIVAVQMEGRQILYTAFDQDAYPTPDQLNSSQWFPIKVLSKSDTVADNYALWFGSTVYVGIEIGAAPGSIYIPGARVLEAAVVMG